MFEVGELFVIKAARNLVFDFAGLHVREALLFVHVILSQTRKSAWTPGCCQVG